VRISTYAPTVTPGTFHGHHRCAKVEYFHKMSLAHLFGEGEIVSMFALPRELLQFFGGNDLQTDRNFEALWISKFYIIPIELCIAIRSLVQ